MWRRVGWSSESGRQMSFVDRFSTSSLFLLHGSRQCRLRRGEVGKKDEVENGWAGPGQTDTASSKHFGPVSLVRD